MSLVPGRAALRACLARVRPPSPEQEDRLLAYCALLDRWNRSQRLVGWRRAEELLERGLLDAWTASPLLEEVGGLPQVDLGSGAGLPAVVLAVADPTRAVTLVEARRKRASFLREVVRGLGLDRVSVHHGRAEELAASRDPAPCLLTSRAFIAPAEFVALASAWNAEACLVSSSAPRLPSAWPPPGWTLRRACAGTASPEAIHQLLLRR